MNKYINKADEHTCPPPHTHTHTHTHIHTHTTKYYLAIKKNKIMPFAATQMELETHTK